MSRGPREKSRKNGGKPGSATSIGNWAFYGCEGLSSVFIGGSVESIGDEAFSGCTGLTSVRIPNSVTSIGNSAFYECSGLASVTIGNSVESIGDDAFSNCFSLTSVISGMESPCTINRFCFIQDVYDKATLYVPQETAQTYRGTDYWSQFKNIEEGEPAVTSVKAATESVPVLISSRDGMLTVKSELEGQSVAVYTVDGKVLGSAKVKGGQAVIATNQPRGTIVVVKVGERIVLVKS